ncbi:threonine/serine ThrE exporter family protein [Ignavigranum ruoffiae]|uniref:threonine/serine ThrE exporter family protein n=1 Tax=Ignavigranum ruoffiae TaxID=89093 RepID=UPI00204F16BC|nr:threonine/serine exporter family protein [Ignavigranum ruoffiae]
MNLKQKYKDLVEVAAQAGIILLESHAESYRVEDTVRRMLQTSGFSKIDVISNTTGLFITLDDDDPLVEPYTIVKRITERGNHLNKIYRVNNISRSLVDGTLSVEEASYLLKLVDDSEYTVINKDMGTILMVVGFAILLGGNIWEVLISFIAGGTVALSRLGQQAWNLNSFIAATFATLLTTLIVNAIVYLVPDYAQSDIIIISALMPLFPGMAFTNGLRDTLKGDYISGVARISDALVIALSIALGVAIGLAIFTGVVS